MNHVGQFVKRKNSSYNHRRHWCLKGTPQSANNIPMRALLVMFGSALCCRRHSTIIENPLPAGPMRTLSPSCSRWQLMCNPLGITPWLNTIALFPRKCLHNCLHPKFLITPWIKAGKAFRDSLEKGFVWLTCSLYKLVIPEREVGVCSADEGQQARNSCPELPSFSLGITPYFLHVYALARYGCLLASLPRPNPLCQYFEFGFWLGADLDQQEWGGA